MQSIPGEYKMRVVGQFAWEASNGHSGAVHAGFVTDGASIPRFFWRFIGTPFGPYRDAAVVHDDLYNKAGQHKLTRKECDEIFYLLMLEIGIRKYTAWMMHKGVRAGGRSTWNGYFKRRQYTPGRVDIR